MKKEIKIALLGIVTLFLTIWGYKFISGKNLFSGDKVYYAEFGNVADVNTATPVLINGYNVGTVVSIAPEPDDVRRIKIGLQVKKEIKLPKDVIVELRAASPLGGKAIELIFERMCDGSNCAEPGSTLQARSIGILGSMVGADELNPVINQVTESIDKTLGTLGDPESTDPVDLSISNLSATMKNMASISGNLERLMARSSKNMEVTLANTAILTESLVNSNEKLSAILNNLTIVTQDLSKIKLTETIGKTNSTIDQAQTSLKNIDVAMGDASETLKNLQMVLDKMSNGNGSMAQLMNDKELYNNLEATTDNLNLLLQDIRLNPRRYFKLFGKKVPEYEYPQEDPAGKGGN